MDLLAAIDIAKQDLDDLRDEIRAMQELLESHKADERKLSRELDGMIGFARRQSDADLTAGSDLSVAPRLGGNVVSITRDEPADALEGLRTVSLAAASRSDAVLGVLQNLGTADRNQIVEEFLAAGRDDADADKISLALSGLKRKGRVESLGDGTWRLTPGSLSELPPALP